MALMPSPMPPGGGPPPASPPGGTGAATSPGGMPGAAHQGMAMVETALKMLQKAVSDIPMGSPIHQKTLKFIADVSKDIGESGGDPDAVKQQIASMARQGPNPQQMGAMERAFPPPQPAGGGGAPPMAA